MIRLMLASLRCTVAGGHAFEGWSPWLDDGMGGRWRSRFCGRCDREQVHRG